MKRPPIEAIEKRAYPGIQHDASMKTIYGLCKYIRHQEGLLATAMSQQLGRRVTVEEYLESNRKTERQEEMSSQWDELTNR